MIIPPYQLKSLITINQFHIQNRNNNLETTNTNCSPFKLDGLPAKLFVTTLIHNLHGNPTNRIRNTVKWTPACVGPKFSYLVDISLE